MAATYPLQLDVLILGGGCAGLWLLDDLRRAGARVLLLEAHELGAGQTAAAQGILHGGLKYSLAGLLSSSARMVREMPSVWEAAIAGQNEPDLSAMRSRAAWCALWRGASLKSWGSMLGAVHTLQVKPVELAERDIPAVLAACPRPVYRLAERVVDPLSLLEVLAGRNRGLIWSVNNPIGAHANDGEFVVQRSDEPSCKMHLRSRWIVLTAGEGNARLREHFSLSSETMQTRPLRVAMVRGELPILNGHCVEGAKTRVTITSAVDRAGRTVWQLGGQISEDGVSMTKDAFLGHARRELAAVLPGFRDEGLDWAEFFVNRAERSTASGLMPGDVQIVREGNVLTCWPTKLVMAPLLSRRVREQLRLPPRPLTSAWQEEANAFSWPAPDIASPPWERELSWKSVS
jgi:glycerol-3-phosphate dehydrogenase